MNTATTHPPILRPVTTDPLRRLRRRLLRDWLVRHGPGPYGRLPWLASAEAEALAWQTPVPLLVLPSLLEEKLEGIRRYVGQPTR